MNPKGNPATLKSFAPGQSGNPGGKPVGSRNRLQGAFFAQLAADFDKDGKVAIRRCRDETPGIYLRVVASLMPKELEIRNAIDDLTDDQLDAAILAVRSILAAQGTGATSRDKDTAETASGLQTVPEAG